MGFSLQEKKSPVTPLKCDTDFAPKRLWVSDVAAQPCSAFGVPTGTLTSDIALTLCQETSVRPLFLVNGNISVGPRLKPVVQMSYSLLSQDGVEGEPCGVLIRALGFLIVFLGIEACCRVNPREGVSCPCCRL